MAVYPVIPGLTFSVFKEPQFKGKIQKAVSGRELRLIYQPVPTWLFKLKYEFLRDKWDVRQAGWGTNLNELRTLMGFFLQQQGTFTPFLFDDPTDDSILNQSLGTGDGVRTTFQLLRTMNGFNEPIVAPNVVSHVYKNGVDGGGWSVNSGTGVVTFSSAPAGGVAVAADFSYYFLVRFADDTLSFENFLYQLWSIGEVKLQSVLL